MDLSFIGDQLGTFADFVGGIKDIFVGFADLFDTIAGFSTGEISTDVDTTGFAGLSSEKTA